MQKTHSASITAGPHTYEAQEKKKGQKIIEMDCRGLEFTEFKPDVSECTILSLVHSPSTVRPLASFTGLAHCSLSNCASRVNGKSRAPSQALLSLGLISLRVNGMTMMRRLERR